MRRWTNVNKIYLFGGRFFLKNEVKMKVENGKFYFIKDEFFDIFKGYKLMVNKEMVIKDLVIFALMIWKIKK